MKEKIGSKIYNNFKIQYLDAFDPERRTLHICIRTTIACLVNIALFQYYGYPNLSTWAGFAAFSYLLNDNTQTTFLLRMRWLIFLIFIFTLIIYLGLSISQYKIIFLITTPVILFIIAYSSCLGVNYFNVGAWVMFLFILAGATTNTQPEIIAITFLIAGLISLIIAFIVYPTSLTKQVKNSIILVLDKLKFELQQNTKNFNMQIDQSFILLDQNISAMTDKTKLSDQQKIVFIQLLRTLQQLNLIIKSVVLYEFQDTRFKMCKNVGIHSLNALRNQVIHKAKINLSEQLANLEQFRNYLKEMRLEEISKTSPSFEVILMKSNYFYHFVKILELTKSASDELDKLQVI